MIRGRQSSNPSDFGRKPRECRDQARRPAAGDPMAVKLPTGISAATGLSSLHSCAIVHMMELAGARWRASGQAKGKWNWEPRTKIPISICSFQAAFGSARPAA